VRYDGGHKRDPFLVETVGRFVEWVKVCPEVECGMDTPREAVRLVDDGTRLRLLTVRTAIDHTETMTVYAGRRVEELASDDLCGYVLKGYSPSCGMEQVPVHGVSGPATRFGRGLFAAALMERHPQLPVEDEARLGARPLWEHFIERVFAYRRLRDLFEGRWTHGDLVAFHAKQRLALMVHVPQAYERLGRFVAQAGSMPPEAVYARYGADFMKALAVMATPRHHASVLRHIAGSVTARLEDGACRELLKTIEDYRVGLLPLSSPLTLARHHVRLHDVPALAGQSYLDPHPAELLAHHN
jgi:uncharacterized protein YbgA (DUF1722 family)/uncharacterized protein YbbK (DUF523 family)